MADAGKKLKDKINEAKETVKNGALDAAGNLLDHRDVDDAIAWVGDQAGKLMEDLKPLDDYLKSMQTKPVDLLFGYSEKEQTARATVGAGEIVVRSNPDQDISDLNRDPSKSMEVKEKSDISLSVKNPVKSITDGIDMVKDARDVADNIADQGGIGNYLKNKTTGKSENTAKTDND